MSVTPAKRYLIVNADDFGQSPGVNRGAAEAYERGIVTSASLMVRWPAASEAAAYAREHPGLGLGLHVDLGEWAHCEGTWIPRYEVVPLNDATAARDELAQQLAAFRRLMDRDPTHIDSHQHVHREEPVRSALIRVARELKVPLRDCGPEIRYDGGFYGQTATGTPMPDGITVDALIGILTRLPAGVTELGCHPGDGHDLDSTYRSERAREVSALCDPRVRAAIAALGITLCSFADLRRAGEDRRSSSEIRQSEREH